MSEESKTRRRQPDNIDLSQKRKRRAMQFSDARSFLALKYKKKKSPCPFTAVSVGWQALLSLQ